MQSDVSIFLDTDAAAAYIHLSASALEKWRVQGRGPKYRKHGRRVLYLRGELDAWSEAQSRSSTAEAA